MNSHDKMILVPIGDGAPATRAEGSTPPRFTFTMIDDVRLGDEPEWLAYGIMPASGFAVVSGPPGAGKSVLLLSFMFSIAAGHSVWAGRNLQQGPCLYITGEGVRGFQKRLRAVQEQHGTIGNGVPFGYIADAPALGNEKGEDLALLITQVRQFVAAVGELPKVIAIDTLARSMAGGDENNAGDMTRFVDRCETIGREFNCLVVVVHHTGKDGSLRGSTALPGTMDTHWSVERGDDANVVQIAKMKDGEDGLSWTFGIRKHVLSQDRNGDDISAAVVDILSDPDFSGQTRTKTRVRPRGQKGRLLQIIGEAIAEHGTLSHGDNDTPAGVRIVTSETVAISVEKAEVFSNVKTLENRERSLSRALDGLNGDGWIAWNNRDEIWLCSNGGKS